MSTKSFAAQKLRIVCNQTLEADNPSSRILGTFILEQTDTSILDGTELHHDNGMKLLETEFVGFQIHRFQTQMIPTSMNPMNVNEFAEGLLSDLSIPRTTEEFKGRRSSKQFLISCIFN